MTLPGCVTCWTRLEKRLSSLQEIPWKDIAGTRDRLTHGYFDVDYDVVWEIISADLPALVTQLKKLVA
ncbi:MAG: DUF86 domain-containing protein [Candidatus Omnitrophota bacterium]|nr:DUF86 domain-containing protein [Candidatus Omnitrophota bacterium]